MKIPTQITPEVAPKEASPKKSDDLRTAAQQFETLFVNELFKVMRKSIPKSEMFGNGFSNQIFTGMLDEQLAQHVAQGSNFGLAEILIQQLGGEVKNPPPPMIDSLLRNSEWVSPISLYSKNFELNQKVGEQQIGEPPKNCGRDHCSIELAAQHGTPVVSASEAVVKDICTDPNSPTGSWIILSHCNDKIFSHYLHLENIPENLEIGQSIKAGEIIGSVGNPDSTTMNAHFHFELRYAQGENHQVIDPGPYLKIWSEKNINSPIKTQDPTELSDDSLKEVTTDNQTRGNFPLSYLQQWKVKK